VLAVVLGGGAALAASGSGNPASDLVGDVAERLGISRDKLENAIEDATIARIDSAVAAGEITKEEGEALEERVRSGDLAAIPPSFRGPGPGVGPLTPPGAFGPGRLAGTDLLDTAADYLGMDEADVREALRDGRSLASARKTRLKWYGDTASSRASAESDKVGLALSASLAPSASALRAFLVTGPPDATRPASASSSRDVATLSARSTGFHAKSREVRNEPD
jgi:hypothetical protein